jgi:hypothetical protein
MKYGYIIMYVFVNIGNLLNLVCLVEMYQRKQNDILWMVQSYINLIE